MNSQKTKALWLYHPHEFSKDNLFIIKGFLHSFVKATSAEVTAVHIKGSDYNKALKSLPTKNSPIFENAYDSDQKSYLSNFSDYINENKTLTHESKSRSDDISTSIDEVERENPDFLIVRSHGRSGLKKIFLGSFTENLISKITTPLICIPNKSYPRPLSSVFIPIDLEDKNLEFLKQIFKNPHFSFIKKVYLFTHTDYGYTYRHSISHAAVYQTADYQNYFEEIQKSDKEKIDKWIQILSTQNPTIDFTNASVGSYRSTEDEIIDQSFLSTSGLIIFQKKGASFISGYLGPISKQVIRNSKLPVCIITK